jgi:SRSO17 transposase
MLAGKQGYDARMLEGMRLEEIKADEISEAFERNMDAYQDVLKNQSQRKYTKAFVGGLLSELDRKSIEPIALTMLGEKEVRGFQQYFKRSRLPDTALLNRYQELLSETLSEPDGFICVDGSDFVKKGAFSPGVARQHCGRLGKTENCQAGVFVSYASDKGYGLLERRLYLPKAWFAEEKQEQRTKCGIPDDTVFKTKNQLASEMIAEIVAGDMFQVRWLGCDAAFGCEHKFLNSLPETLCYFAATHKNEFIFTGRPEMYVPENVRNGRRYKHARPMFPPVQVSEIAENEDYPWERHTLAMGSKGLITADVKCLRCVSCESTTEFGNYVASGKDIWLYVRKYNNGEIKFFVSNAPEDTSIETLDCLATIRWSVEQCFQECKSYLGMTHYETRSWIAWHRHMLLVMMAHLFTLQLRDDFKKTLPHNAHGKIVDF